MTTLKLNKKSDNTLIKATKAPVRRTAVAKRDRSSPPAKVISPTNAELPIGRQAPAVNVPSITTLPKTGQRNHRFDGKLHEDVDADAIQTEHTASPAKSTDTREQPPRQARPQGVDTRTTPRPDKNEPQYRQAPRRGGKVRDGSSGYETITFGYP